MKKYLPCILLSALTAVIAAGAYLYHKKRSRRTAIYLTRPVKTNDSSVEMKPTAASTTVPENSPSETGNMPADETTEPTATPAAIMPETAVFQEDDTEPEDPEQALYEMYAEVLGISAGEVKDIVDGKEQSAL